MEFVGLCPRIYKHVTDLREVDCVLVLYFSWFPLMPPIFLMAFTHVELEHTNIVISTKDACKLKQVRTADLFFSGDFNSHLWTIHFNSTQR